MCIIKLTQMHKLKKILFFIYSHTFKQLFSLFVFYVIKLK